jgi:hypothetical protein
LGNKWRKRKITQMDTRKKVIKKNDSANYGGSHL